jgi:hypothetical protein
VVEDPHAAPPDVAMTIKREVDLVDAVAFGARPELGFGACGASAEQDAIRWVHR